MRSLNNILDYITADNQNSLSIYNEFACILKKSLENYEKSNNILAIFFIDLLKLITQTQLKSREIKNKKNIQQFISNEQINWPYIGYPDLVGDLCYEEKSFGKGADGRFTKNNKFSIKKNTYIFFSNKLKGIINKRNKKLLFFGESSLTTKNSIDLISSRADIKTLNVEYPYVYISKLNEQIEFLSIELGRVLDQHFEDKIFVKNLILIFINHVKSFITHNNNIRPYDADFLVMGSGYELGNRIIASIAEKQNIPVVNIIHGEAFGVYDEPTWGKYGEQMYSSYILGYGNAFARNKRNFLFEQNDEAKYIPSNSESILSSYQGKEVCKPDKKNKKYFYLPTTYRGFDGRFGPYQDLPDSLYIEWQIILARIFDKNIIMKLHPKERYPSLLKRVQMEKINKSFSEIFDQVDVFVFDYIGSAFNQACATNKPVIYFDIGLRNISSHAMTKIKERTVYFNLENDELPSLTEIEERIFEMTKVNNLTKNYSLTNTLKIRSQSLLEALEI